MTHRRRGLLFAAASAAAAVIAASIVARHERSAAAAGELRPVAIAREALEAGQRIGEGGLELRRFPAAFVPPEALASPAQAVGARAAVSLPRGAYLTPGMLRSANSPQRRAAARGGPMAFGTPVEITIAGAGALRRMGGGARRVDVLVTRDSPRRLGGRTEVVVAGARLIGLEPGGGAGDWKATLAVRRSEALELIEADSYAREIRLIAAAR